MNLPAVSTNHLLQSPALLEARYSKRATVLNLASKTALVAIVAIAATASAVFLFGLTLTGASPLLLLGSVLTTPALMYGSGKAADAAQQALKNGANERGVITALLDFKTLSDFRLNEVCRNLFLDPITTPYTAEEFDILMARFGFWHQQALTLLDKANRHIYTDYAESELLKIDESKVTPKEASLLRYTTRDTGSRILENEAIPAMLQSVLILQVLSNPRQPPTLEQVAKLYPKTLAIRLSEQFYDQNDVYMAFFDASRPALTREEIVRLFTSGAPALQKRIFG